MFKYLFTLLFVLFFVSSVGFAKKSANNASIQEEKTEENEIPKSKSLVIENLKKNGKLIYEDNSIKIYQKQGLMGDRWVAGGAKSGSIFKTYKLLFENISDAPLKLQGDIFNRVSKANAQVEVNLQAERLIQYNKNLYSATQPGGLVGVWGADIANAVIRKKRDALKAQIEKNIIDDKVFNFEILPKNAEVIEFLLPLDKKEEPSMALKYGSEKFFVKGIDEALAKRLLSDETLYNKAFLDGQISEKETGIWIAPNTNAEPDLNQAIFIKPINLEKENKITKTLEGIKAEKNFKAKEFRIFILQNIKQEPEGNFFVLSRVSVNEKNNQRMISEETPLFGANMKPGEKIMVYKKEIKPQIIEIKTQKVLPSGEYVLRNTQTNFAYDFSIEK